MKKNRVCLKLMIAGLLLLAACGSYQQAVPTGVPEEPQLTEEAITPTIALISPTPAEVPTVEPTNSMMATPTVELTETPIIGPTETSTATPTIGPTKTPTATPTAELTEAPTATPTEAPTATPTPTATPIPTATPTINPEPFVTNGWQKTVSIDEQYAIVFPERFRDTYVTKTDRELTLTYLCTEQPEIEFVICYRMQQTLEQTVEDLLLAGGSILEYREEEYRVQYQLPTEEMMYCGILTENPYSDELLGFGEEELIRGVMEVVFSYPISQAEEYETETYSFYVVKNREE